MYFFCISTFHWAIFCRDTRSLRHFATQYLLRHCRSLPDRGERQTNSLACSVKSNSKNKPALLRIGAFSSRGNSSPKAKPAPLRCSMATGAVCRPLCETVWVQRGYIFFQIPAWSEFRSTLQTNHRLPWRASAWLNDRSRHEQKALANTPSVCRSFWSFFL